MYELRSLVVAGLLTLSASHALCQHESTDRAGRTEAHRTGPHRTGPHRTGPNRNGPSAVRLVYATFDPLLQPGSAVPHNVPTALRSGAGAGEANGVGLWIVQWQRSPEASERAAINAVDGRRVCYLPDDAYLVRMTSEACAELGRDERVRWIGSYHPAYRLHPDLHAQLAWSEPTPQPFCMVVADKHRDKPALVAQIAAIGGVVDNRQPGSLLLHATLTGAQLVQVAAFDEVLWLERAGHPERDVDNARIQGGANYVEAAVGYTGAGINAHSYEGLEANHPDFTGGATAVRSNAGVDIHGHCAAGIIFGNGTSNPAVRGLAPDVGKFYTNWASVNTSRWQVVRDLVELHDVSHTTASWGDPRTQLYIAISADTDDIIFDHDIAWTQSQSNAGNQDSRPQAWAKNVFSIGAVYHYDNATASDDSWGGGASTGPAADGRIKPTLCGYYDQIGTSDVTGFLGFGSGSWFAGFSGTSGATPIVAGHNVLAIQMFTDEVTPGFGTFGNALRVPGGTPHQNRPHFPTLKALQVVGARRYAFAAASVDNRREHQGWGFPDLQQLYDRRDRVFLVDETDVLVSGQVRNWDVTVSAGEPTLAICLNWSEPAANPAAAAHLVNDLSLRVTSPLGTSYWGNNGLDDGNWSRVNGSEDDVNSIECVFVQNPAAGTWTVEVLASSVVADNHVESSQVDVDYGLVVLGGTGSAGTPARFETFGYGCDGTLTLPNPPCFEFNGAGGTLTQVATPHEYLYTIADQNTPPVVGVEFFTASTGGTVTVPVAFYEYLSSPPIATGSITVGPTPAFYPVTMTGSVSTNSTLYCSLDLTAQTIYPSELTAGTANLVRRRTGPTSFWVTFPARYALRLYCEPTRVRPRLAHAGLPSLGGSYAVELSYALPNSFSVLVSGMSASSSGSGSLPVALPGAPGCLLHVSPDVLIAQPTGSAGTGSWSINVPTATNLIGTRVYHQYAVLDSANALGVVLTEAGRAVVGN